MYNVQWLIEYFSMEFISKCVYWEDTFQNFVIREHDELQLEIMSG